MAGRASLGLAAEELRRHGAQETGASRRVALRALLKQRRQLSYEEMAFHLENSSSFRAFARLPLWTAARKLTRVLSEAIDHLFGTLRVRSCNGRGSRFYELHI